jgi:hypothetical protein
MTEGKIRQPKTSPGMTRGFHDTGGQRREIVKGDGGREDVHLKEG